MKFVSSGQKLMSDQPNLQTLDPIVRPSVADQVFSELHKQIVSLTLKPGARISEIEVAKALGTSRQPVRDAFYRLSQQGFLEIRPQRATQVSLISPEAVAQASFVRTALELEIVSAACKNMTPDWEERIRNNLYRQKQAAEADQRRVFHALDEDFHEYLCLLSGHSFAWQIVQESKSHLDRVRLLSLSFNQHRTLDEHRAIFDAVRKGDAELSKQLMREHLSRLGDEIDRIRFENPTYFAGQ